MKPIRFPYPGNFIILAGFVLLYSYGCARFTDKEPETLDYSSVNWDSVFVSQGLEKVKTHNTNIRVDLRYSGTNNFFGKDIYGNLNEVYLRPKAVDQLREAARILKKRNPGLQFLIYDGARPRRIQQYLWDVVDLPEDQKSSYVAHPESGSIHNYGFAVDLTLADTSGKELDMGTDFDDFSTKAHIDQEEMLMEKGILTRKQVENRQILRDVMVDAGFIPLITEWWHFDALPRSEVVTNYNIIE